LCAAVELRFFPETIKIVPPLIMNKGNGGYRL